MAIPIIFSPLEPKGRFTMRVSSVRLVASLIGITWARKEALDRIQLPSSFFYGAILFSACSRQRRCVRLGSTSPSHYLGKGQLIHHARLITDPSLVKPPNPNPNPNDTGTPAIATPEQGNVSPYICMTLMPGTSILRCCCTEAARFQR